MARISSPADSPPLFRANALVLLSFESQTPERGVCIAEEALDFDATEDAFCKRACANAYRASASRTRARAASAAAQATRAVEVSSPVFVSALVSVSAAFELETETSEAPRPSLFWQAPLDPLDPLFFASLATSSDVDKGTACGLGVSGANKADCAWEGREMFSSPQSARRSTLAVPSLAKLDAAASAGPGPRATSKARHPTSTATAGDRSRLVGRCSKCCSVRCSVGRRCSRCSSSVAPNSARFVPTGVAAPDWLALTEALALAIKSSISRTVSVGNGVPAFRAPRAVECKAQSASRHGVANVVWLSSTLPIQSSPSKSESPRGDSLGDCSINTRS